MAVVQYANLDSCRAYLVELLGVTPDTAEAALRDTAGRAGAGNLPFYRPGFAAAALLARKQHDRTLIATKSASFRSPEKTIAGWLGEQRRNDLTYEVEVKDHLAARASNLLPEDDGPEGFSFSPASFTVPTRRSY